MKLFARVLAIQSFIARQNCEQVRITNESVSEILAVCKYTKRVVNTYRLALEQAKHVIVDGCTKALKKVPGVLSVATSGATRQHLW